MMSELPPDHDVANKQTRRGWMLIGGLGGLLLVALIIVCSSDDELEDDSDLRPHFTPGGGEHNPLAEFTREMKANPIVGYDKLPPKVKAREKGTESEMRAFVDQQVQPRNAFTKLMTTDPETWRWPDMNERWTFRSDLSYLSPCQEFSNVFRLSIQALANEGKNAEAAREALQLTQYGLRLVQSKGPVIHWLVGITSYRTGEAALEVALAGPQTTPDFLHEIQTNLEKLELLPTGLSLSFQIELIAAHNSFEDIKKGSAKAKEMGLEEWETFMLKPNRTINGYRKMLKPVIQSLTQQEWFAAVKEMRKQKEIIEQWNEQKFQMVINPNALGNKTIAKSVSELIGIGQRGPASAAFHRQTILQLALRRFELETGKLPVKLDELVPKYLATIPLDPFDNAPMRWNTSTQIIYSIGIDLKDEGGRMAKYAKHSEPDISMKYWWAAP